MSLRETGEARITPRINIIKQIQKQYTVGLKQKILSFILKEIPKIQVKIGFMTAAWSVHVCLKYEMLNILELSKNSKK